MDIEGFDDGPFCVLAHRHDFLRVCCNKSEFENVPISCETSFQTFVRVKKIDEIMDGGDIGAKIEYRNMYMWEKHIVKTLSVEPKKEDYLLRKRTGFLANQNFTESRRWNDKFIKSMLAKKKNVFGNIIRHFLNLLRRIRKFRIFLILSKVYDSVWGQYVRMYAIFRGGTLRDRILIVFYEDGEYEARIFPGISVCRPIHSTIYTDAHEKYKR